MKRFVSISVIGITFLLSVRSSFAQVHQEWMKRFSAAPTLVDKAKFIVVDDSANVIVAGVSNTNVSNRGEMCVTKYNARGDSLWTSVFEESGSFNSDDVNGLAIDTSRILLSQVTRINHPIGMMTFLLQPLNTIIFQENRCFSNDT